jgi:hypothetical protein
MLSAFFFFFDVSSSTVQVVAELCFHWSSRLLRDCLRNPQIFWSRCHFVIVVVRGMRRPFHFEFDHSDPNFKPITCSIHFLCREGRVIYLSRTGDRNKRALFEANLLIETGTARDPKTTLLFCASSRLPPY